MALPKKSVRCIGLGRNGMSDLQILLHDEAQKRVAEIAQQTAYKPGAPNKEWAEKLFARYALGDDVPEIAIHFAERALGRARPGRHV